MNSTELEKDVLASFDLSLRATKSKDLSELDKKIKIIKDDDFLNFLEGATLNLNPEEKQRVENFLSTRKSYLEMEKESRT